MKKHTNKFGLLIVDDDIDWRQIYRKALSEHFKLKNTWDSVKEYDNANSALEYIKKYQEEGDYHFLVVADAYMPPNCDGNKVLEAGKLFGGLWLIDEVNKEPHLKGFVTILLITYYDETIKPYRNGNKAEFPYIENEDYFFVVKPISESSSISVDQAKNKLLSEDSETIKNLFSKTFEAIWAIIDSKRKPEVLQVELINSSALPVTMIGNSKKMKEIYNLIEKGGPTDANVLITGESGTGKELVAINLHRLNNKRKGNPFIPVNCASIPETLIESELFGSEKGAFTGAASRRIGKFEAADKGTIFLDEVGDMSLPAQAKVLRVIQEKRFERVGGNKPIEVDVRIVAATNKNLSEEVKRGNFREDLYYRLNVIPIHMPPLRERKEDIPLFVEHFLKKYNTENTKSVTIFNEALNILKEYNWPGNVRELENIIERLVVLSNRLITADDVKKNLSQESSKPMITFSGTGLPTLKDVEKELIRAALIQSDGNKDKAADIVGISRASIYAKIKEYGIENN